MGVKTKQCLSMVGAKKKEISDRDVMRRQRIFKLISCFSCFGGLLTFSEKCGKLSKNCQHLVGSVVKKTKICSGKGDLKNKQASLQPSA